MTGQIYLFVHETYFFRALALKKILYAQTINLMIQAVYELQSIYIYQNSVMQHDIRYPPSTHNHSLSNKVYYTFILPHLVSYL